MIVDWLLSFAPILFILILMVRFRWGASKAGAAGWLATVAIAVTWFGVGIDVLALAQTKALLLTLDVLLIVWAAFLLYRVADEAGAIKTLGTALPHLTADRGMQAILIGWSFASFLQGVGGFGVPVAVTAPLLVGLGFSPVLAVIVPSIGHSWSVTFGSLASSFQALMAASGMPGTVLGPPSALVLGLAGFGCGLMVVHVVDGWSGIRRLALPVIILAIVMGVVQYWLVANTLWNIGGFGAGMAGLLVGFILARWYRGNRSEDDGKLDVRAVALAFSAYLALIVITLLIVFVTPLSNFLGQIVIQTQFPKMQTALGFTTPAESGRKIVLLTHAGAVLAYASVVAYLIYRWAGLYSPGAAGRIVGGTVKQVMSSSLGIASMVGLATVMSHAGMTDVLARGLAQGVGALFPLASPWVGALGAFMTGSNTNSNVVFTALQKRTAELLGYSVPLILAAQTAGAAIGSVVAPTKIVVGASTAGLAGKEGPVLRGLLLYTGILIAGISVVVWILMGVMPR
ncbi:MAG: L-lactate permease [Methanothrix sp.]|nr:L-lactate permease [Methanothrix sp.]